MIKKKKNKKGLKELPKSILENIKSKYCLNYIFEYIKDDSFKFRIFVHSKLFQTKLDLNITQYHIKYLERFKLDPKRFLSFQNMNSDICLGTKVLKDGLIKYLSDKKVNNDIFQEYSLKYFELYFKYKNEIFYIDIFSPLLDKLSESREVFEKIFIILNLQNIRKYNLELNYNSFFQKLRKLKKNYYSLSISFSFIDDISYFNKLYIDFNTLKRLELNFGFDINQDNALGKILFNNKNLEYNLEYFHLICSGETIDPKLFEDINNFYSLKELNIERIKFKEILILELPNLINLSISFSNNIFLSEKTSLKIQKLFLHKFTIDQNGLLHKYPKLEECLCNIQYLETIDISSLLNLRKLTIECTNKSPVILNDFIDKIPHLLSLNIILDKDVQEIYNKDNQIVIFESPQIKIKELSLKINGCFSQIVSKINKFENLSSFKIDISGISGKKNSNQTSIAPENYFPIFKDICTIKFNYLRIFEFCTYKNKYDYLIIKSDIINNLYNNLFHLNNLLSFKFVTITEIFSTDLYRKFIKKLLSLEIFEIEFDIKLLDGKYKDIDYTVKELNIIFPIFNYNKFKKLEIKKFEGKDEFVE